MKELKALSKERNKKVSGKKEVLAIRVFKLINYIDSGSSGESDEDSPDEGSLSDAATSTPLSWKAASTEDLPPIRERNIKNHFLYTKNPVSGHTRNFAKGKEIVC